MGDGLHGCHSVLNEHSVEVVEFVLECPCRESLCVFGEGISVEVSCGNGALFEPFYFGGDAGEGKTSFFKMHQRAGSFDLRIDIDLCVFFSAVERNDEDAQVHPCLRAGEANTFVPEHYIDHTIGESADGPVDVVDGFCGLSQNRCRETGYIIFCEIIF